MSQANNFPVVTFAANGAAPALPADLAQSMAAMYADTFNGLGGANLRRIKVRKTDFLLIDGKNQEPVPADQLIGVQVGSSPCNHAVWYEKDYAPGQEPEAPDLTWLMPTPDTFPAALPAQFREKVLRGGQERWAFQIMRRVAFALLRNVNGKSVLDLEHPYIMDLTSMSLFGKGLPEQNMYKWSGIRDVCNQHSIPGMQVTPSMFMTQIILDPNTSVNGVVLFRPMRDNNGQLRFLDADVIRAVFDCAQKPSTRDMCTIREKLTYEGAPAVTPQAVYGTPPAGQVMADPTLLGAPVAPVTPVAPVMQATQPMAGFATAPVNPVEQLQSAPSSVVQAPQQVVMPTPVVGQAAGMPNANHLLMQAEQLLGTPNAVSATPASSAPAPVIPPMSAAPIPAPGGDPVVDASVAGLLAALQ